MVLPEATARLQLIPGIGSLDLPPKPSSGSWAPRTH
ncbi:hypothetical protein SMICM17S_10172 [Streptomyces microflavus]